MTKNLTQKLIEAKLADGEISPGADISLKVDQTLTQDATGTLVMLVLESMNLDRVKTELSAQYVDHNLLQEDFRNADDHLFLLSACNRFGIWYSRPGNGVSHPVHMQRFGKPGQILLGSDSHTCAAGSLGMLAMGAGGVDVAMAMAGEPFHMRMPEVWGIELKGALPDWVSAKDVILEILRRHGVEGGKGRILEFYGPDVETLSAMDRHVICNMAVETGANTGIFPSDAETRRFLKSEGRGEDWTELKADDGADYDVHEEIDLSKLVPLIAKPASPGNVVPVSEVEGEKIYQAYIGSSANPGYRDFAVAARMVDGRITAPHVSFDINPTSRQLLQEISRDGSLASLLGAGARLHQTGCNGCIGMGQAPATDRPSLRTVPRNFPGRSGTREDWVFLCSPETATASALSGKITDPRSMDMDYPRIEPPSDPRIDKALLVGPLAEEKAKKVELDKGPNIEALPDFDAMPDTLNLKALLKVDDDISTDEIMPAGASILPYRSNIPKISDFVFNAVDEDYSANAEKLLAGEDYDGHAIIAGKNYGQGSSREHAAIAPRYLGLRVVMAKGFARIHRQNLINFGVLPLMFEDDGAYDSVKTGEAFSFEDLRSQIRNEDVITARLNDKEDVTFKHDLSGRDRQIVLAGGLINYFKEEKTE